MAHFAKTHFAKSPQIRIRGNWRTFDLLKITFTDLVFVYDKYTKSVLCKYNGSKSLFDKDHFCPLEENDSLIGKYNDYEPYHLKILKRHNPLNYEEVIDIITQNLKIDIDNINTQQVTSENNDNQNNYSLINNDGTLSKRMLFLPLIFELQEESLTDIHILEVINNINTIKYTSDDMITIFEFIKSCKNRVKYNYFEQIKNIIDR